MKQPSIGFLISTKIFSDSESPIRSIDEKNRFVAREINHCDTRICWPFLQIKPQLARLNAESDLFQNETVAFGLTRSTLLTYQKCPSAKSGRAPPTGSYGCATGTKEWVAMVSELDESITTRIAGRSAVETAASAHAISDPARQSSGEFQR
ncbi:MAG: hypothetical protein ACO1NM_09875 [Sphingobium phenoxybenzoativorans]